MVLADQHGSTHIHNNWSLHQLIFAFLELLSLQKQLSYYPSYLVVIVFFIGDWLQPLYNAFFSIWYYV